MMNYRKYGAAPLRITLVIGVLFLFGACNLPGSSSNDSSTPSTASPTPHATSTPAPSISATLGFPVTLALASIFSSGVSSFTAQYRDQAASPSPAASASPGASPVGSASPAPAGGSTAFDSTQSFEEKTAAIETVVTASTAAACQVVLPNIGGAQSNPDCYGPTLEYINHLDATGSAVDNNSTNDHPGNTGLDDDGGLPSGDLGIWSSTDSASGAACTAAKMNGLINYGAANLDAALLLSASMYCVMKVNSLALPAAGGTTTLTSYLNTAIQVHNSTTTVSLATISRLTDVGGNAVYLYTVKTSQTGTPTITSVTYMKHMDTATDGSTFTGKIYGSVESGSGGMGGFAYSMLYKKASASVLNYKMVSGMYTPTNGNPNPSTLFSSAGDLVISTTTPGADLRQLIANLDPTTGLGNLSFAWQAGINDDKTRVFNAFTRTTTSTAVEGCGFFGYGPNFNPSTGALPSNAISTFICNWAGPGNQHTGQVGKAQKQCMLQNATTGVFAVDSTREDIAYAPVNSCSYDGTSKNSGALSFNWALPVTGGAWGAGLTVANHAAVTNNLVTLSSDADYAHYTAPSAPTDPF